VRRLAEGLDRARRSRSRIAKEEAIGAALAKIGAGGGPDDDIALAAAARLAVGRTLPMGDGRSLGTGYSLLIEMASASSGYRPEIVGACARAAGDLGEAIGLLAARAPGAAARPGLALSQVASLFEALASTGNRVAKRRALDAAFARATPLETKYLAKALLGSLRVGAQAGVVEGAIARAFEVPLDDVRRALGVVTDVGEVAVLARDGKLAEARQRIGRPVAFMLASPIETMATPLEVERYVMEDKIDGVRAQVHKEGSLVAIFARGLDRMTAAFPEVAEAFQFATGSVMLDGEIVAVLPDGRPRPFQALQARLRRVRPTPEMIADTPVAFVAYDLLFDGERDLLGEPWSVRRAALEAYASTRAPRTAFALNPVSPLPPPPSPGARLSPADVARAIDVPFEAARARGFEGLVLKRVDGPYEAGRRGQSWLKVKRAFATLDVVVTAAEEGHGRRAGVLSDYTFGVWKDDRIVDVGKAYSGLTDEEIDAMSARLDTLALPGAGARGRVRRVEPVIVLEVAFDGVQPSARHESGYALRFPRIVRIRDDKEPEQADRLETVASLFRAQVETGHREHAGPPKKAARASPKAAAPKAQLNLFGDLGAPRGAPKGRGG
jgi:DNA ligase-1